MNTQPNLPKNIQSPSTSHLLSQTQNQPQQLTFTKIVEKFNREQALETANQQPLSASQLTYQRQRLTFPGLFYQQQQQELQKNQLNSNIKQSCIKNEDFEKNRNSMNKGKDSREDVRVDKKTQKIIRKVQAKVASFPKPQQFLKQANELHPRNNDSNYLKIESHIEDLLNYSDVKPMGELKNEGSRGDHEEVKVRVLPVQNLTSLRLIPSQLSYQNMPNRIQQKLKDQTGSAKLTPQAAAHHQNLKSKFDLKSDSDHTFLHDPIITYRDAVTPNLPAANLQSRKFGLQQSNQSFQSRDRAEGVRAEPASKTKIQEYQKFQVNNKKPADKQKWLEPCYSEKDCCLNKVESLDRIKFREEHKRTSTEAITSCNDRIHSKPDRRKNQTVEIQASVPEEDSNKEYSRIPIQQHIIEKFKDIEMALKYLKQNSRSNQNLLDPQQLSRTQEAVRSPQKSRQSRQSDMQAILQKVQQITKLAPKVSNKHHQSKDQEPTRSKVQNLKSEFLISKQIMDLKQKILQIQQETSFKRPEKSSNNRQKFLFNQEDTNTQKKKKSNSLTINYRECLPSGNHRGPQTKRSKEDGKQSRVYEQIDEQFNIKTIQVPDLFDCPDLSNTKGELKQKGIDALQTFEVDSKLYTEMDILKFDNRVEYYLPEIDVFVCWEYTGKFYIGESKLSKTKQMRYKQGKGIQMMPDQYVYQGNFKNNLKSGEAIINFSGGNKYQGEWKNDKFHGKGKLITEQSKYDGQFYKGLKSGCGKQYFQNKDLYVGQYEQGKFHGKGRYIWRNQSEYIGYFKKGYMEGLGEWISQKGDSYKGQYFKNLKHGQGVYRWRNGRIFKGIFINGQVQDNQTIRVSNTIPVEKQICYDLVNSDDQSKQSQLVEREKQGEYQFIFNSFGSNPRERKDQQRHNYGQLL